MHADQNLPTPDFTYDEKNPPFKAGVRPYRVGTFRLDVEVDRNKTIIHNYGHGGAGITLSWGCAHEVKDIVSALGFDFRQKSIAVLGGGVMGMTAAKLLRELHVNVTVYSKAFIPHTTSSVAGGQWAPSVIEYERTSEGLRRFNRILRRAYRTHESYIGLGWGISRRDNYTERKADSFSKVPTDVVPTPEELERLPFENHQSHGFVYQTLLIEPPIFLSRLQGELIQQGVAFVQREFGRDTTGVLHDSVFDLTEDVLVNCTGLGSRNIWADPSLIPIKGQLVLLPPQPCLQYLYAPERGYIFPRADGVVCGGTFEFGVDDETPDPVRCAEIVRLLKSKFQPGAIAPAFWPDWFIQGK